MSKHYKNQKPMAQFSEEELEQMNILKAHSVEEFIGKKIREIRVGSRLCPVCHFDYENGNIHETEYLTDIFVYDLPESMEHNFLRSYLASDYPLIMNVKPDGFGIAICNACDQAYGYITARHGCAAFPLRQRKMKIVRYGQDEGEATSIKDLKKDMGEYKKILLDIAVEICQQRKDNEGLHELACELFNQSENKSELFGKLSNTVLDGDDLDQFIVENKDLLIRESTMTKLMWEVDDLLNQTKLENIRFDALSFEEI